MKKSRITAKAQTKDVKALLNEAIKARTRSMAAQTEAPVTAMLSTPTAPKPTASAPSPLPADVTKRASEGNPDYPPLIGTAPCGCPALQGRPPAPLISFPADRTRNQGDGEGEGEEEEAAEDLVDSATVIVPRATVPDSPSQRRSRESTSEIMISAPTVAPLNPKAILGILPGPSDTNLRDWISRCMKAVPELGDGNTPSDRILANAMQEKLRRSGRKPDADWLEHEFAQNDPEWAAILQRLNVLCPKDELDYIATVDHFRDNYIWNESKPYAVVTRHLRKMEIPLDKTIKSNHDGLRLFQMLRQKTPPGYRPHLQGRERNTWEEVLQPLQKFWNMEQADNNAASKTKKPLLSLASIPAPIHYHYHISNTSLPPAKSQTRRPNRLRQRNDQQPPEPQLRDFTPRDADEAAQFAQKAATHPHFKQRNNTRISLQTTNKRSP